RNVLLKVLQDNKYELFEDKEMVSISVESVFLFNSDVYKFIMDIKNKILKLNSISEELVKNDLNEEYRERLIKDKFSIRDWINYEFENLDKRFESYLSLKRLK
ncbi:MAG: hypothetical protein GXO47_01000, partial [Chlorobi bacterium]|nr:hypothetical protein [Chlorobiota bacterium]